MCQNQPCLESVKKVGNLFIIPIILKRKQKYPGLGTKVTYYAVRIMHIAISYLSRLRMDVTSSENDLEPKNPFGIQLKRLSKH